jgi:two-component system nitrate/nitrite response regulator NarL
MDTASQSSGRLTDPGSTGATPPAIVVAVVIVSDVRLLRDGLAGSLVRFPHIKVVGTVTHADALPLIVAVRDAIILVDVGTPSALELIRTARKAAANIRCVAFAASEGDDTIISCAEAGVLGYVSQDGSIQEVLAAIEHACRNEVQCSPRVAASLFRRLALVADTHEPAAEALPLTRREREIVGCIDRGLSNKEIARELGIQLTTVKNHVHNLLDKLSATRRGEAAARVRAGHSPLPKHALHRDAPEPPAAR